jgi:hypothetical protein
MPMRRPSCTSGLGTRGPDSVSYVHQLVLHGLIAERQGKATPGHTDMCWELHQHEKRMELSLNLCTEKPEAQVGG